MVETVQNREISKLGVASFVLGLVSVISSLVPFLGLLLVFPLGGTGVGLGIAALAKEKKRHPLSVLGLVFSAISIPIAIFVTAVVSVGTSVGAERVIEKSITYTMDGDADRADITYSVIVDGVETTKSENVTLPWSLTIAPDSVAGAVTAEGVELSGSTGSIFDENETSLRCSISVDGELQIEQTSAGVQPKVACLVE